MARKKRLRQGKQREPSPRTPLRQPKRKPHDPAYTPSQDATPQAPTSDYHSPNRNIAWREDIKPEAKKAVIEASPSHDACLVCQIANKYGKTTCAAHLIDKGLAGFEDLIVALAYHWGMRTGSLRLFLHSRYNIVILCLIHHNWLDERIIMLFPAHKDIVKMAKFKKRPIKKRREQPALQYMDNGPVRECTLAFCDHEEGDEFVRHTIHRQEDGTWKNGPDEERKVYKAPFTDKELASIATHVNPFFLAWNAGRKIDELSEEKIASLPPTIIDDAKQILALYRSWATTVSVSKKLLAPSPSPLVLTRVRPAPNALKRKDREESPSEAAAERKRRRTSPVSTSKSTGTRT
ncbi:hypothetical protein CPB85DRAFT_1255642 [Mucidula mucida]|nr:hypothetical protein CPB85DRAFT_1255642 [Mucidula mucida]